MNHPRTPIAAAVSAATTPADLADYVVFIGRFEPFHNGHLTVSCSAFEHGRKIIFIIGSAQEPRMPKNPWNASERATMIRHSLADAGIAADRILIGEAVNYNNDNLWLADVQREVARLISLDGGDPTTARIRIIGRDKDRSSYYIKSFPQWGTPISVERTQVMGATEMRDHYFSNDRGADMLIQANVPPAVFSLMQAFRKTGAYEDLVEADYKNKHYEYGPGPHITTDAVILCLGHILVVERKFHPGKGLLALPGGFLKRHLSLFDSMMDELTEETRLKVPKSVLAHSLRLTRTFDAVDRDPRARIITHVFGFVLENETVLPKTRGGDDAKRSFWMPISEFLAMRERLFLDHHSIGSDIASAPEMR